MEDDTIMQDKIHLLEDADLLLEAISMLPTDERDELAKIMKAMYHYGQYYATSDFDLRLIVDSVDEVHDFSKLLDAALDAYLSEAYEDLKELS